jgi:hypothetical protein
MAGAIVSVGSDFAIADLVPHETKEILLASSAHSDPCWKTVAGL